MGDVPLMIDCRNAAHTHNADPVAPCPYCERDAARTRVGELDRSVVVWQNRATAAEARALAAEHALGRMREALQRITDAHSREMPLMEARFPRDCGCGLCLFIDEALALPVPTGDASP